MKSTSRTPSRASAAGEAAADKILRRLERFIGTRSDTATPYEKSFESMLLEAVDSIPGFSEKGGLRGQSPIPGDALERSVIWALSGTDRDQTVIVFGHHDTVDDAAYGMLSAYSPEDLKRQLKLSSMDTLLEDVTSDAWLFGRGSCDMKAGLVIALNALEEAVAGDYPVNILFLSVPDEENMSLGMRHAVSLLGDLQADYRLQYDMGILTEPHEREREKAFTISTGSVGKMMPLLVVRGLPTHAGNAHGGLNAISILTELVKAIELNTEMCDIEVQRMTPPPAFLEAKSIRRHYDVTTPEYAAGYFNWLFLGGELTKKMEQLRELCKWSMEDAINQLNYSYNEFLRKQKRPSYVNCIPFTFEILLLEELIEAVKDKVDPEAIYAGLDEALSEADRTVAYVQALIEHLGVAHPIVVIALLPPYYPPVNSGAYFGGRIETICAEALWEKGLSLQVHPYFMGISDMSYMTASSVDGTPIQSNMPALHKRYHIDFEGIARLNIPVLHIGPWGKDLHQKTERVYIRDVVETVPHLIRRIVHAL